MRMAVMVEMRPDIQRNSRNEDVDKDVRMD
jgi:hypothetical protein